MSFKSFLSAIGHDIEKVLAVAVPIEQASSPYIALFNPGVAAALNLATGTIVSVEQKMAAKGAIAGTGPQKLADVMAISGPALVQLFAQEGIKVDTPKLTAILNGIVAVLNAIPAPSAPATPPAV